MKTSVNDNYFLLHQTMYNYRKQVPFVHAGDKIKGSLEAQ